MKHVTYDIDLRCGMGSPFTSRSQATNHYFFLISLQKHGLSRSSVHPSLISAATRSLISSMDMPRPAVHGGGRGIRQAPPARKPRNECDPSQPCAASNCPPPPLESQEPWGRASLSHGNLHQQKDVPLCRFVIPLWSLHKCALSRVLGLSRRQGPATRTRASTMSPGVP